MSDWPKYESHKVVEAARIVNVSRVGDTDSPGVWTVTGIKVDPGNGEIEEFWPTQNDMAAQSAVGCYAVRYADGFRSISPANAFEEGYTRVPGGSK